MGTQKNPISLETQIKKVIGNRTLACVFVLLFLLIALTVYDVCDSIKHLKGNIYDRVKPLEDFTISQLLINNTQAVDVKLSNFNRSNSSFKVEWKPDNASSSKAVTWIFPFSWKYDYKLSEIAGYPFGNFQITGSLLKDKDLVDDLIIRISLLLIFTLTIIGFLYPLAKKIPEKLFINPINRFIQLISNPNADKTGIASQLPIELEELETKILHLLSQAKEQERNRAATELGRLTTQVAHDIRAPLAALRVAVNSLSSISEKTRLDINNAVQRVNDIANNLLSQYKRENSQITSGNHISSELLPLLLESVISEKRIQVSNSNIKIKLDVHKNAYDAFINVNTIEFKRALSNIINNSIEAVDNDGIITITLSKEHGKVEISIVDNGCGIPKDQLPSVFEEGKSFGKKQGMGLGLTYAADKISSWHGNYSLRSEPEKGTQLDITFPEASAAEWFAKEIIIPEFGTIVILDDDEHIHDIWNARFTKDFIDKYQLKIIHFHTPIELIDFCESNQSKHVTFLLDYELLGYKENGLTLAEMLNLGSSATLVTNRYEDFDVRESCKKLGMKILPKPFADIIKITVFSKSDFILIDDEKMLHQFWRESAEDAGKSINIFDDPQNLMRVLHLYGKDTTIYIDSSLGNDVKGELFAKKLYDLGYKNLVLATGYPKENFKECYWLKDIIGKQPPF